MNDMKTMNIKSTDYRVQITESGSVPGSVLAAIRKASVLCTLCSVLLISSCTHDEITPPVNTTNDALALLPGETRVGISAEVGEVTSRSSELTSVTTGTYTMTLPRGASAIVIRESNISVEGVNTTNFPLYLKDFNLVEGNNRCVTRWALLEGDNVTDYVLGWARLTHNNGQPTLDFGQLKHANSKITLIVKDGENSTVDFSSGNKASFALQGASTQAVVTATGEELTAYLGGIKKLADDPTDASGFSLKVVADADADNTGDFSVVDGKVEAIVRPTPTGGELAVTDKLTITIADDYSGLTSSQTGGTYSLKLKDVKLSDTEYLTALEPGKHYTLTVTLRHNTLVAATATIGAWSTASASAALGGDGAKLPSYEYNAETNTYTILEDAGIEKVLADMKANADRANATVMMNGAEWTIVDGTVTDLATVQAAISGKTHIIVTGAELADYSNGNYYAETVVGVAIYQLTQSGDETNNGTINLILPEVTTIGDQEFYGCTALTSVSAPKATMIGIEAFYNCTSLTSVELPAATTIGDGAFYECTSLTSVELPAATTIGMYAFGACDNITSLTFGSVITSVDEQAFHGYYTNWPSNCDLTLAAGQQHIVGGTPTGSRVTFGETKWAEYFWKSITLK